MKRWSLLAAAALSACATSVDPQKPRPYPCVPDAGDPAQCPGNWRCGLNGTCHDPSVPAAYACRTNSDCELGWHCGLNGSCHDPKVAIAYGCLTDLDCEGGWRCGPDQVCLDARAEGLVAPAFAAVPPALRISPVLAGPPQAYAVGPVTSPNQYPGYVRQHSELRDGGLVHIRHYPGSNQDDQFVDARAFALRSPQVTGIAATGESSFVLDALGVEQLWIQADGGPARAALAGNLDGGATRLRITEEGIQTFPSISCVFSPSSNLLMQVGPSRYELWASGTFPAAPGQDLPWTNGTLNDLVGFWTPVSLCDQDLMAATSEGLFVAHRDAGAFVSNASTCGGAVPCWVPVNAQPLFNTQCSPPRPVIQPLEVRTHPLTGTPAYQGPHYPMAFRVSAPDGGLDPYVVFLILQDDPYYPPPFPLPLTACQSIQEQTNFQWTAACPACLPGEKLVDFHPSDYFTVTTRCLPADGGTQEVARDVTGGGLPDGGQSCAFIDAYEDFLYLSGSPTVPAQGAAGAEFADSFGRAWHREDDGHLFDVSLTLDQTPGLVVGSLDTFLRARYGVYQGGMMSFLYQPGFGMTQAFSDALGDGAVCGGVSGMPWMLTSNDGSGPTAAVLLAPLTGVSRQGAIRIGQTPPPPMGQLNGSADVINSGLCSQSSPPPMQGFVQSTADGGTELIAFSGDTLWGGDVTSLASDGGWDGGTVFIDVRAVPLPRQAITSGVAVAGTQGDLLDGYLLIQQHLLRFRVRTQNLWTTDELFPPAGNAVGLWKDGDRARLGFADGTAYSLPSLVPVAAPLPPSAGSATQYAGVCGAGYALASNGMYQLQAPSDGGVVGSWRPVPLDGALGPGELAGVGGGTIYADPPRLLVFTSAGSVAALTVPRAQCP